ncbi:MAG: hypothetical protein ABSA52_08275 [Candidatus Binatia bacterium]|jgi:hypothetical protein
MRRQSDRVVLSALFLVAFTIFLSSGVHQIFDSEYSMLLSESLLYHHTLTLDHYAFPGINAPLPLDSGSNPKPHQLEVVKGHVYYAYPFGSSILSVPYVALMNALGVSAANADATFNFSGEKTIEKTLAALLMAGLISIFYCTARLLLPVSWSAIVALSAGLGTQVWSTASRGLWSDTWGIFLLGLVIWVLLASETRGATIRPFLLATLLAWTYFVRPTYAVAIIAISAYILVCRRQLFVSYVLTGCAWFVAFVAYSWNAFGQPLPAYYRQGASFSLQHLRTGLAANLISPSRGLLVFAPVVLFAVYLVIRYRREIAAPRLVLVAGGAITVHLLTVSTYQCWWAGHSYGARFSTDLVPWFMLLGILGLSGRAERLRRQPPPAMRCGLRAELVVGILLLAWSVALNAVGATSGRAARWNAEPVDINARPDRIWDWRHAQFWPG